MSEHKNRMGSSGLDTPLPCDVWINAAIVFRKGVALRTLVEAAARWHQTAERIAAKLHNKGFVDLAEQVRKGKA